MISRMWHGSSPAFQDVCHWSRAEHEVRHLGVHDFVAEERSHPTGELVAVPILARVPVERCHERPGQDRVLYNEKPPSVSPVQAISPHQPTEATLLPSLVPSLRGPCEASKRRWAVVYERAICGRRRWLNTAVRGPRTIVGACQTPLNGGEHRNDRGGPSRRTGSASAPRRNAPPGSRCASVDAPGR